MNERIKRIEAYYRTFEDEYLVREIYYLAVEYDTDPEGIEKIRALQHVLRERLEKTSIAE